MLAPLSAYTVVERPAADTPLCVRLAIALAGRMLADLGARVIVVEPPQGDSLRRVPPTLQPAPRGEQSPHIQIHPQNKNK
ncbi:MAG: CoA transferase, partial [Burkholderiaceae bacterium]|nr:CoA transferase [Burkholderiaceae bacterium]